MSAHPNELEVIDPRNNALARQQTAGIISAVPSDQLTQAVTEYKRIQNALDTAMPDCIMQIGPKQFRKKQYWRGVRMAFNLEVVAVGEERIEIPGDWGYTVTYRATAPNGSSADGDGACMASEKEVRDKKSGELIPWKTKQAQTVHNVRSHAHTRAMNRAISNLVGFGEVSAEEADRNGDEDGDTPPTARQTWTAEQEQDWFRQIEALGADPAAFSNWLVTAQGLPHPSEMTPTQRTNALAKLESKRAKESQTKSAHHPSFDADRARFMATITDLGHNYETLAPAVEANEKYGKRPSAMTQQERDGLVSDLTRAFNDQSMANRIRQEAEARVADK